MDILYSRKINSILHSSNLIEKYNQHVDRESAYEILSGKMADAQDKKEEMERQREQGKQAGGRRSSRKEKSMAEKVFESTTTRQIGRTVARELTRGLLGVLGVKTTTRRRKSTRSWF